FGLEQMLLAATLNSSPKPATNCSDCSTFWSGRLRRLSFMRIDLIGITLSIERIMTVQVLAANAPETFSKPTHQRWERSVGNEPQGIYRKTRSRELRPQS